MINHEEKRQKFENEIKSVLDNYKPSMTPGETLTAIESLLSNHYPNTTLIGRVASLVNEIDVLHGKYEYHIALIENLEQRIINLQEKNTEMEYNISKNGYMFLLHLVDVVWNTAKESEEVPSTKWAKEMIDKANETYKSKASANG